MTEAISPLSNMNDSSFEGELPAGEQEDLAEGEICGWYMYDWANSPFFQVLAGPIMPILLKWLAEGHARASGQHREPGEHLRDLTVPELGISAGAYPPLVQLVTTVCQVLCLLSFCAFGDYGARRKQLLTGLTWLGSFLICLNVFCYSSSMWWLAGVLRVLAGCCFCLCTVYYNSYLPMLAAAHPEVKQASAEERSAKFEEVSDGLSGKGMMIGYLGGMVMLFGVAGILYNFECRRAVAEQSGETGLDADACTEFDLYFWPSLCAALVGVWWTVFSSYSLTKLKTRPGPAFPTGTNPLFLGWKQSVATLKLVGQYKQMMLFIFAYLIYSDAYNTIVSVAPLILESQAPNTTMFSVVANTILAAIGSILGIFMMLRIQSCTAAKGKAMIMGMLLVYAVVSGFAGFGGIERLGAPGFYVVMVPCLLILGSIQSYTRSLFASLIPPGQEAAFFSFYAITDKGSNVIGPIVMGWVHNTTHKYTGTFLYLLPAFLLSALILHFVDVEKGIEDVRKVSARGAEAARPLSEGASDEKPAADAFSREPPGSKDCLLGCGAARC